MERERPSNLLRDWYQSAFDRVASNAHRTIATVGLNAPVDAFVDGKSKFVVRMDLPGMDPGDIEARVRHGELAVEGRRRNSHGPSENMVRSDVVYGRFRRSLPLPSWVRNGRAEVQYEDGVLEIRLDTDPQTCPHSAVFKPPTIAEKRRSPAKDAPARASA